MSNHAVTKPKPRGENETKKQDVGLWNGLTGALFVVDCPDSETKNRQMSDSFEKYLNVWRNEKQIIKLLERDRSIAGVLVELFVVKLERHQ